VGRPFTVPDPAGAGSVRNGDLLQLAGHPGGSRDVPVEMLATIWSMSPMFAVSRSTVPALRGARNWQRTHSALRGRGAAAGRTVLP
jgi:hypothetical protein